MTTSDEPERPLLGIAAHDPGLDRRLRRDLATLRERSSGTELATLLDDVLAGRRTLPEVARTEAFTAAVMPKVQTMMTQWSQLSQDEKDALVEAGRRELDAERAAAAVEATRRTEPGR